MWLAVLLSGVHATVAGVLLAMTIPARTRINPGAFLERGQAYLADFADFADFVGEGTAAGDGRAAEHGGDGSQTDHSGFMTEGQQTAVLALEEACEQVQTPLHRLEHALHPWVAFAIVLLFALANGGVTFGDDVEAVVA